MRTHGSGRACYNGQRPPEGSCEPCKAYRRTYVRKWYRTPEGQESIRQSHIRYASSAKGFLAGIRGGAKHRSQ